MDEKKVKEAIEYLSGYIQSNINLIEKIEGIVWIGEEPCKTAIEALEKQLPMKPEEVVGGIYREFYECKNCGSEIEPLDIYEDYCKWCGQRLDWTES